MTTKQTTKKTYTFRKFMGDIHLWLGIASGLVLFLVCLSGTIFTFREEVIQLLNKDIYCIDKSDYTKPLPINQLVEHVAKETKSKVNSISIPNDPSLAWSFSVSPSKVKKPEKAGAVLPERQIGRKQQEERATKERQSREEGVHQPKRSRHGRGRGTTYLVNPYTAQLQGTTANNKSAEFFMTMMQLHRWLLIEGGTGKMIVGVATLIFLILTLTGLVLWAPAKWRQMKSWKMWKPGFVIKTGNWKRFNHDLHNTLGFYSFLLLTIMALTGLCWSFEWYREGVSNLMGAKVFGGRNEKFPGSIVPGQTGRKLSAADYLAVAKTHLPYPGDIRLTLPTDDSASAVIAKNKVGFFAAAATDKLVIDQYSGKLIKVDRFRDKALNEQLVASIRPLHLGNVYGTFSKILYFIACLIATSLPVTGTIIWINKLNKKSKKKHKKLEKLNEVHISNAMP